MYRNSLDWLGPLLAVFVAQIAVTFLSRLAPTLAPALAAGSHNLVFSLKQAGVPLGGVLAGLLLPPIVDSAGLTATFMLCAGLALTTLASIQPLQRRLDAGRDRAQSTHPRLLLSLANLRRPLRALARDSALHRVAAVGAFLAIGQGMWFIYLVSFLVLEMRLSLTAAGALFALMQIVSVVARPVMGLLADRSSASAVLKFLCIASTITTVALALLTPQWPHWALLTLLVTAGFTVSSWNGVQLAQIAYFARPEAVAESTAGATLLVFLSSIMAPMVFGGIVALGGDFRIGFGVAAICTLAALVPLSRLPRQSARIV